MFKIGDIVKVKDNPEDIHYFERWGFGMGELKLIRIKSSTTDYPLGIFTEVAGGRKQVTCYLSRVELVPNYDGKNLIERKILEMSARRKALGYRF